MAVNSPRPRDSIPHAFLKYVMSLTLRSAPRSLGRPNGSSMWPSGDRCASDVCVLSCPTYARDAFRLDEAD